MLSHDSSSMNRLKRPVYQRIIAQVLKWEAEVNTIIIIIIDIIHKLIFIFKTITISWFLFLQLKQSDLRILRMRFYFCRTIQEVSKEL